MHYNICGDIFENDKNDNNSWSATTSKFNLST